MTIGTGVLIIYGVEDVMDSKKAAAIRAAAERDANGYSDALVQKGWTRERAEQHWLVAKLRRVAATAK